ncbi:hypothetical protein ABZ801_36050 [Actinomadura sp. NPDC047616]|uniref:hypothetical protein n=1 Tax=Actinomadura sp. NPDC047616 TaxID=3155914 RepID=UPI0033C2377D
MTDNRTVTDHMNHSHANNTAAAGGLFGRLACVETAAANPPTTAIRATGKSQGLEPFP